MRWQCSNSAKRLQAPHSPQRAATLRSLLRVSRLIPPPLAALAGQARWSATSDSRMQLKLDVVFSSTMICKQTTRRITDGVSDMNVWVRTHAGELM